MVQNARFFLCFFFPSFLFLHIYTDGRSNYYKKFSRGAKEKPSFCSGHFVSSRFRQFRLLGIFFVERRKMLLSPILYASCLFSHINVSHSAIVMF